MTTAPSSRAHFYNRFRYVVLFLGVLCLTCIAINYSVINFTFICMTEDKNDMIPYGNGTRQRYDYSTKEKSMIIWAVGLGTILGMIPVNWASINFGARWTFFGAGMLSAVTTALTPWAAGMHLWALIVLRFFQGVAYAADFAAIGVVVVRWAPIKQTAIFIGMLTAFTAISGIMTNPITGAFCASTMGWRAAFYFFAAFSALCFTLWMLLYKDDPEYHKAVSPKELATIQRDKTKEHINRDSFMPYREICTNPTVLVCWLNAFGELVGTVMILTYAPIYINKVLKYSMGQTALLSTLGSIFLFIFKITCGILSDWITCMTERSKMIMFNLLAVGLNGILCGAIGLTPIPMVAVFCLSASQSLVGFNTGGFLKCGSLHARQYGHFVLSMNQFAKSVALFVGPILVAVFVHEDTDAKGWMTVFLIMGVIMIVGAIAFCFVATGEPAEFTKITRETYEAKRAAKKAAKLGQVFPLDALPKV